MRSCGSLVTGYITVRQGAVHASPTSSHAAPVSSLQNTDIQHNEVWNASDGSIESGWGWGGGDYDTNITSKATINLIRVGHHAVTLHPAIQSRTTRSLTRYVLS